MADDHCGCRFSDQKLLECPVHANIRRELEDARVVLSQFRASLTALIQPACADCKQSVDPIEAITLTLCRSCAGKMLD